MPIETSVTHIADLEPLYPFGTDNRLQGDNHIRNIKTALKNDLPLTTPATATGIALLTAANAAAARTTLGVSASSDVYLKTETYSDTETDTAISTAVSGINVAQIQPLTAVAVGNDLVITLAATKLDFRDASLPSGDVTTVSTIADTTLTIVNGATLGSANGVATRYEVVAMDNAGVLELAAANLSGGNVTDDAKLLSTTILNTSSDSANVYYSTAARTNLPQRYVGFIALSQATAGVYASQPTQVQGAGGTLTQSVPAARAYADVTGSRAYATTYTNSNAREMHVIVTGTQANSSQSFTILVDGNTVGTISGYDGSGGQFQPHVSFPVPAGSTYRVNATGGALTNWRELV